MAAEPFRAPASRGRLTVPGTQPDDAADRAAPPLSGFRVVDLSTWIAGAYCTKLLADGGAEVIKVEAPAGDPLRRWSASGAAIPDDDDGALFNFLGASKRSVVVDACGRRQSGLPAHAVGLGRRRGLVAGLAVGGAGVAGPAGAAARPSAPGRHVDHTVRPRRPLE